MGSQFSTLIRNTEEHHPNAYNHFGWLAGDRKLITVYLKQIMPLPFLSLYSMEEKGGKDLAYKTVSHRVT